MSDVAIGFRLAEVLSEIKQSIASIEAGRIRISNPSHDVNKPYEQAHNAGLSYAYQRSADLIEEALSIDSEAKS